MIEHIPEDVKTAFLYFHSAGTTSQEIEPYLSRMIEHLSTTYIWAGDGVICGRPVMRQGAHYGNDPKRSWFMFPMQDTSSNESFATHVEAMGATLMCSGAYINAWVDQILARFHLSAQHVVLCGFQHGSCVALAASMMRLHDPYSHTILLEPFLLEGYYLRDEPTLPSTTVVCIENQFIRDRAQNLLQDDTDHVFQSYGMVTQQITVPGGEHSLNAHMMDEVISVMEALDV